MDFGIASVAGITVICYLIGQIVKAADFNSKLIPCIVGMFGGFFGVLGLYFMPDFPADNWITALAVGIVSGLASTGAHQAVKQMKEG